jgi:hypothetical protein
VYKLEYSAAFILQVPALMAEHGTSGIVGSQILAALIVGLLVAFAFQLLLTTFGVAVGITALGFRATASPASNLSKGSSTSVLLLDWAY